MKNLEPLSPYYNYNSLWRSFMPGMASHSPFIMTVGHMLSDLDTCIIGMRAPHVVARVHTFLTNYDPTYTGDNQADRNATRRQFAENAERNRHDFMQRILDAEKIAIEAEGQQQTPREYQEANGQRYDFELDEQRMIVKVPGLNVYLELLGCLDPVGDFFRAPFTDFLIEELQQMSIWYPTTQQRNKIERMKTSPKQWQPLEEWHDEYDPDVRPLRPSPAGLTDPRNLDLDRHPELQYSKLSYRDGRNTDKAIKEDQQRRNFQR